MNQTDLNRLRKEYEERKTRSSLSGLYSPFYPPYLFFSQQKTRALVRLLKRCGIESLAGKTLLEIGCGSGGVLQEYQSLGVEPNHLFGIDLLFDRLQVCQTKLPAAGICNADGQALPFPNECFDMVLQYTAFSSVLDAEIRSQMAREMLRVLKPDGSIIWYDFWWNPTNPQTHGIKPKEIKSLFPNCNYTFHKTSLAPPIARRIVPVWWGLALFLESLGIFNSHYLVIIRKQ